MIIDCIGLPASGKSTVCNMLCDRINMDGCHLLTRDKAMRLCLRRREDGLLRSMLKFLPSVIRDPFVGPQFALREWHMFATDHVALLQHIYSVLHNYQTSREFRECILHGFMQQGIKWELFRRYLRPDESVLWDEGFLHRGFTLFGYLPPGTVRSEMIAHYVKSIPLPSVVIWVNPPVKTVIHRIEDRLKHGIGLPFLLEPCVKEKWFSQLAHGYACVERLVALAEKEGVHVLRTESFPSNEDGLWRALSDVLVSLVHRSASSERHACMS